MAPTRKRVLIATGIALLLRVLLPVSSAITVGDEDVFLFPDSLEYVRPAEELLRSGRFAHGDRPEIIRTPGYPLLLLPGVVLGNVVAVTIALQVILSLFTVWLVHRVTLRLCENQNAAAAAALLYAIEPLSILYSALVLTETLFTWLVVACFTLLVDYFKRRQAPSTLILAAVTLAASVYVRPAGYYLPFLFSMVLLPTLLLRFRKMKYALHALVFLLVSAGLVFAWQARNRVMTGYTGFSAISDINLYLYQAAAVRARLDGRPLRVVRQRMESFEGHPERHTWTESRRYAIMRQLGTETLASHPLVYASIHCEGVLRTLLDPGSVDFLKLFHIYPKLGGTLAEVADRGLIRVVIGFAGSQPRVFWTLLTLAALLSVYYLLATLGAFSTSCAARGYRLILVAISAYFVAVSGGPHGYSRFRHPAMPFVCILAGCGLCSVMRRNTRRSAKTSGGHPTETCGKRPRKTRKLVFTGAFRESGIHRNLASFNPSRAS